MQTITRGLVPYEGPAEGYSRRESAGGEAWRTQVDMAAACLAAAALQSGMPRVADSYGNERQLAAFLADRVAHKRRTAALKFLVVTLCEIVGVAAGLYIGAMP
jgi:hypothetical protein